MLASLQHILSHCNGYFSTLELCKANESGWLKNAPPSTVSMLSKEMGIICCAGRSSTAWALHPSLFRQAKTQLYMWFARRVYFNAICSLQLWNQELFLPLTCLNGFHRFPDWFWTNHRLFGPSSGRWISTLHEGFQETDTALAQVSPCYYQPFGWFTYHLKSKVIMMSLMIFILNVYLRLTT